jgi:hypothetical protein
MFLNPDPADGCKGPKLNLLEAVSEYLMALKIRSFCNEIWETEKGKIKRNARIVAKMILIMGSCGLVAKNEARMQVEIGSLTSELQQRADAVDSKPARRGDARRVEKEGILNTGNSHERSWSWALNCSDLREDCLLSK